MDAIVRTESLDFRNIKCRRVLPVLTHRALNICWVVVWLTHINFVVVVVLFFFFLAFLYVLYVSHKLNFIMLKSDVWLTVHRNSVWIRKTN